jgi:ParB-like chromosome segregation protein Spo0J
MDRIPARVLSTNDKATHEIALRENLDRVDLHPIEEGEGYVSLLEAQAYSSHEGIAKAFGKPKSRITECIGFTRLPDLTKQELLRVGIKNRALLRQLLSVEPANHLNLIAEAAGKEEVFGDLSQNYLKTPGASKENPAPPKPFAYKVDAKGVSIPSFKWKKSEDSQNLKNYCETLKKILSELEQILSQS